MPKSGGLDLMCHELGRLPLDRCYSNGASLIRRLFGDEPPFAELNAQAEHVPAGCGGCRVMPFLDSEPSLGVMKPCYRWTSEPADDGVRFRACLEAIAYLIALRRPRSSRGRAEDRADHGLGRTGPQRPDVPDPGDGARLRKSTSPSERFARTKGPPWEQPRRRSPHA